MTWRKRNVKAATPATSGATAVPHDPESIDAPLAADVGDDPRHEPGDEPGDDGAASSWGAPCIGQSVHVQGELKSHEDVTIEGHVEGRITVDDHALTVGPTGVVHAEIRARSVLVEGQVVGNVTADDRVEVAPSGSVIGDIRAARVVLAEGARFRGNIDMGSNVDVPVHDQPAEEPTRRRHDAGAGTTSRKNALASLFDDAPAEIAAAR